MRSKTVDAYKSFYAALNKRWRELGHKARVEAIHSDYEEAELQALAETYGIDVGLRVFFKRTPS